MPHTRGKVSGELVGGVEVVAVKLNIDGRLSTHVALSGRNRGGDNFDMLPQDFTDTIGNLRNELVTLGLLHQTDVVGEQVRTVVAHQAPGVVLIRHTHGIVDGFDLVRVLFTDFLHNLVTQRLGGLHTCALGQFHGSTQTSVILSREKFGRNHFQQSQAGEEDERGNTDNRLAVVDTPAEQFGVAVIQTGKETFNRTVNLGKPFALLGILLQQERTEHRGQRHSGCQ